MSAPAAPSSIGPEEGRTGRGTTADDGGEIDAPAAAVPAPRRRLPLRATLALSYAALTAVVGVALITIVYLVTRFVPLHLNLTIPSEQAAGSSDTQVDFNVEIAEDFANALFPISAGVLVVLVLIAAALGWFVAARVLRPVSTVASAARRVSAGNLDEPVALGGPNDEIRELADSFDRMQDSVRASIDAHRRFAANASHELRTPLATIQTLIDVSLADPGMTTDDFREVLGQIRTANVGSIETTTALLDLADAETGNIRHEEVDLVDALSEALAPLRPLAEEKSLRIAVEETPARLLGNPVLIRQAISNLLRNAIVHNAHGGAIRVAITRGTARASSSSTTGRSSRPSASPYSSSPSSARAAGP
ncbi:sensor histidine kinase [Actinomyces culturomici]|uniref:sensor histidine kinase n=1 Tax=Actinomyces culturomici TaxID=1926276 RepID=UPI000E20C2BD|nr:HAMP domain-containing protein [Actinomyces culturomici]